MLESIDFQREAKKLKIALQNKTIDQSECLKLLDCLEFRHRARDILKWGQYYFPDKFTQSFCYELHNYLVKIRQETRTNTLAPRGYAKTTIKCFLIPIYQALNEPEKFRHYLNIQSTTSKAIAINLAIREEIETNELLRRDYGDLVGDEKWTEKQYVLKNGVVFTAIGAGESVRGINYRNTRPDYIVGDDLYDEDDIYSLERVRKKNRWFWSSIYKALSKDKHACIHLQGTAIHREDLMHTLPKDIWVSNKFQAVKDVDKKQVLWPEVETFDKLMEDKKMMGSIIFAREMMNDLHDDENAIVKSDNICYYKVLPEVKDYIWSWDTAIEEGSQSDFTVGTLWAECHDGYYLVDMFRKQIAFPELQRVIKEKFSMMPARAALVEKKASGHQIVQVFKDNTTIPIIPMIQGKNMGKKKSERLILCSGLFESLKVKFPEGKPWVVDIVDELINFPHASHDDIVDSITQYLSYKMGFMNQDKYSIVVL